MTFTSRGESAGWGADGEWYDPAPASWTAEDPEVESVDLNYPRDTVVISDADESSGEPIN